MKAYEAKELFIKLESILEELSLKNCNHKNNVSFSLQIEILK